MTLSKLRDLFQLTEEDAISKFQDFNIIPSYKLFCLRYWIASPIIFLVMKILLHNVYKIINKY